METLSFPTPAASIRPGSIPSKTPKTMPFSTSITITGSSFVGNPLFLKSGSKTTISSRKSRKSGAMAVKSGLIGENPEWSESDYVAIGLAHCFTNTDGKLQDYFVIEPIPASGLECMYNGGATAYKCVVGSTLGEVLKEDVGLLPEEFRVGVFGDKFETRAKAAARTWKREYAQGHLMHLAPPGEVKRDFNFSLVDKRVLGVVREVRDDDNIKQDMSIDVYGRKNKEEKEDEESLVSALYNV